MNEYYWAASPGGALVLYNRGHTQIGFERGYIRFNKSTESWAVFSRRDIGYKCESTYDQGLSMEQAKSLLEVLCRMDS